jgi:hypothetical protein
MMIQLKNHKNMKLKLENIRKRKMKMITKQRANPKATKSLPFVVLLFMATAGFLLSSPEVLAVGNAPDQGLTTGVNNLIAILENKLTPVILIAGCLAALVYSLAVAQPKPFLLSLVTLCGFGFAKAWISGTYALIG